MVVIIYGTFVITSTILFSTNFIEKTRNSRPLTIIKLYGFLKVIDPTLSITNSVLRSTP